MSGGDDVRVDVLGRLPVAYSLALRLREAGVTEELIAEHLGVEVEAVRPMLAVADAKLAALQGDAALQDGDAPG